MTAFGIDLGTTRTSIAMVAPFQPARGWFGLPTVLSLPDGVTTPSAILFEDETEVIGLAALNMGNRAADCAVLFKRDMPNADASFTPASRPDERFSPVDLSARLLEHVREHGERASGLPVVQVVITVPAYFGEYERRRTREAGQRAGLEVLDIINEPTAAMLAYLFQAGAEELAEPVLVFDLGGGTFDSVVVDIRQDAVRAVAIGGDVELGGRDLDNTVANYLADRFLEAEPDADIPLADANNQAKLLREVEQARENLSSAQQVNIAVWGTGDHAARSLNVAVERARLEQVVDGLVERAVGITRQIIETARDKGTVPTRVLFVGGTTKMPAIRRRVMAEFGLREIESGNEPDLLVAKGAAVWAQRQILVERVRRELDLADLSTVDWTAPGPLGLLTTLYTETGLHTDILRRLLTLSVETVTSRGYAVRCLDRATNTLVLSYLVHAQDQLPYVGQAQRYQRVTATSDWFIAVYEDTPDHPGTSDPAKARSVEQVSAPAGRMFEQGSSLWVKMSLSPSQILDVEVWNDGEERGRGIRRTLVV